MQHLANVQLFIKEKLMARKHFESHTDLDKNVTTTSDQRPLALPEKLRAVRGFLKIKTE